MSETSVSETKTTAIAIQAGSLLDTIINTHKLVPALPDPAKHDEAVQAYVQALTVFVSEKRLHPATVAKKKAVMQVLQDQIAEIDAWLSAEISTIMRTPEFQSLEAAWRGLRYLVFNSETGESLKLRVFPIDKKDLGDDLSQAIDKDQSNLFKKVYEEEYGIYGGNPFSLLIGDYYFEKTPADFALLRNISGVAAAAHTPFIASAHWRLFGLETFKDLGVKRDLSKIFEATDLTEWRSFRASDDSRYVTLCLPRFLLRLPYGPKAITSEKFAMDENPPQDDGSANEDWKEKVRPMDKDQYYLWGNAAYALGARITNAFALYNWCAAIRGPEGGGVVADLPAHVFDTLEGDKALKCPTEVAITDRREFELDKLGFVALVHRKGENSAAFFGGATTQKPKKFDLDAANANAALSARLPYLLAASRFAHYLKVICRDKVGSFQTKETLSQFLNRWIMQYVLALDDAGQDLKAQYPLREARIDVVDVPGKPGAYSAVCFLRPHFQLEELTTSIRLVAELPPPAAA